MTTLTMRDKKRLDVKQRVFRSYLTVEQAAVVGGKASGSVTGSKRGSARLELRGNPGRRCKRKIKEKVVKRIVELAKGKYKTSKIIIWPTSSKSKKRSHCLGRNCASSFVPTPSHHRGSDAGSSTVAAEKDGVAL